MLYYRRRKKGRRRRRVDGDERGQAQLQDAQEPVWQLPRVDVQPEDPEGQDQGEGQKGREQGQQEEEEKVSVKSSLRVHVHSIQRFIHSDQEIMITPYFLDFWFSRVFLTSLNPSSWLFLYDEIKDCPFAMFAASMFLNHPSLDAHELKFDETQFVGSQIPHPTCLNLIIREKSRGIGYGLL